MFSFPSRERAQATRAAAEGEFAGLAPIVSNFVSAEARIEPGTWVSWYPLAASGR